MNAKIVNKISKIIEQLKSRKLGFLYCELDKTSMHLRLYSNSSSSYKEDRTSQAAYLVLFAKRNNKCNIINYRSYKSRIIVKSQITATFYEFVDALKYACTLKQGLERMMEHCIPLQMFSDSKSMFCVMIKSSENA